MDDSDGLGNRIVIIVYTSVFYELSVALVRRVGRRWCGETPCGGFGAGLRLEWCASAVPRRSNDLARLFSDIGARRQSITRRTTVCVGVRVRGLRRD